LWAITERIVLAENSVKREKRKNSKSWPVETAAPVEIRKKHGFPQELGKAFGFPTVSTRPYEDLSD
jgi:hypothetical protein